jgi:hypothetical protein
MRTTIGRRSHARDVYAPEFDTGAIHFRLANERTNEMTPAFRMQLDSILTHTVPLRGREMPWVFTEHGLVQMWVF